VTLELRPATRAVLGVTSFVPALVSMAAVVYLATLPPSASWERAVPPVLVLVACALVGGVTMVVHLVHLLTSGEVARAQRLRWVLVLLLLGVLGNPLYYMHHVRQGPR
jgi:uncharacterized membrane protein